VLWKSAKKIGCGYAVCHKKEKITRHNIELGKWISKIVTVCQYDTGNIVNKLCENLPNIPDGKCKEPGTGTDTPQKQKHALRGKGGHQQQVMQSDGKKETLDTADEFKPLTQVAKDESCITIKSEANAAQCALKISCKKVTVKTKKSKPMNLPQTGGATLQIPGRKCEDLSAKIQA